MRPHDHLLLDNATRMLERHEKNEEAKVDEQLVEDEASE